MSSKIIAVWFISVLFFSCHKGVTPIAENALKPKFITEPTAHDTDDPAIWVHPDDYSKSRVIGTDKNTDGGLYMYDLEGKIVAKVLGLKRPNNVDIAYQFDLNGTLTDIAVLTERENKKLRVFRLPDMKPIDGGGIPIFEGESGKDHQAAMGIALYTHKENDATEVYAIVGRKSGPSGEYLWQYQLKANEKGAVEGKLVRKFGHYSGKKEIEAIAVDNEQGYVYYSDETAGIRKYHAHPKSSSSHQQLAFFGQKDFKQDHEGIAIYKTGEKTGYILVSNQQNNTFMVYTREGSSQGPHDHVLLTEIPVSTMECDGAEVVNVPLNENFPKGLFVAMSNGKVFHYYDWRDFQKKIDQR